MDTKEQQPAPPLQTQASPPAPSPLPPATGLPPGYTLGKPGSCHSANAPAPHAHFEESDCHAYLHILHILSEQHNIPACGLQTILPDKHNPLVLSKYDMP